MFNSIKKYIIMYNILLIDLYVKLPSLFAARLFWTFHNKLHNMKALAILSHHYQHFSHLLVFMKKNFLWVPMSSSGVFSWEKTPHSSPFQHRGSIGICAQISRNTLLYLPYLKREFPIVMLMLISAWLTVSKAFNCDEKPLLNYSCLISNIINHCKSHVKWLISI